MYIEGKIRTRKYTDKDGIEKFATDIIADQMQMLGGKSEGTQEQSKPPARSNANASQGSASTSRTAQIKDSPPFDDADIPF